MSNRLFFGPIVHSKSLRDLQLIPNGFLAIKEGKIVAVGDQIKQKRALDELYRSADRYEEVRLSETQFLMPGLIDCHIHAPQMPNLGLGLDRPLLDWLQEYTFPLESQYTNLEFAKQVYSKVVTTTIRNGTTLACYFGTNHKSGCMVLAKEALKQGQRVFVGKVASNCNCPDYYVETTEQSIKDNTEFIDNVLAMKSPLVQPIITPRFAISCDANLMQKLADLAIKYDLNIQTHISENLEETEFVRALFSKGYAAVYDSCHLLTPKCVLAHGVHLYDDELPLLKARGTSIAHCPASNTNLGSGLCDVRRLLNSGVTVGLGTDVSGGDRASILCAMRDALAVSKHIDFMKKQHIQGTGHVVDPEAADTYIPLSFKEVLFLATLGGAEALSVDNRVGNFEPGKDFDALLIETNRIPIDQFELPAALKDKKTKDDILLQMVQQFVYVGDDRNIAQVFVQGLQVKPF